MKSNSGLTVILNKVKQWMVPCFFYTPMIISWEFFCLGGERHAEGKTSRIFKEK